MANLQLTSANPKRAEGFTGAFASFACKASNIVEAVDALCKEFEESGYVLVGIEHMLPVESLNRQLTTYESVLVAAVATYPIQFRDVHLHKGDS
jgi:hypothetical protein